MKINVYKGFPLTFLEKIKDVSLVDSSCAEKVNVPGFDRKYRKRIDIAVLSMEDEDVRWMTYEEYAIAHDRIDLTVAEENAEVCIYRNNLLPDYYPLPFELDTGLLDEALKQLNEDSVTNQSDECKQLLSVYSDIVPIDGKVYGKLSIEAEQ